MWKCIYIHQKDNGTTFLSVTATSALPYYTDACHLRMYVSLPKKVNYYCLSKNPLLKVTWINIKKYLLILNYILILKTRTDKQKPAQNKLNQH